MSTSSKFKIDITSDVRCPFCILGVTQITQALEQYNNAHPSEKIDPEIRILPFELDPTIGPEPESKDVVMKRKFGARADGLSEMMKQRFLDQGLPAPKKDATTSSSHLAQRLQAYTLAKHPEKQFPLYQDILKAYHIEGIYPAHKPTLAKIAVDHGVFGSTEEATKWLEGDAFDAEVRKGYNNARASGISGVPFFVFQDKYAASGAIGTESLVKTLEEIKKREASA